MYVGHRNVSTSYNVHVYLSRSVYDNMRMYISHVQHMHAAYIFVLDFVFSGICIKLCNILKVSGDLLCIGLACTDIQP